MLKCKTVSGFVAIFFGLFAMTAIAAEESPSGTVTLEQVEVSFIGSAKAGGGTLTYQGKSYPFRLGGLGVGGFGISKISATGNVYKLKNLADFQGVFGGLRAGIVVVDKGLKGGLWLENTKGVVMHLTPKREGLALSMGADGVVIELEK
jgi:hypothetical protein